MKVYRKQGDDIEFVREYTKAELKTKRPPVERPQKKEAVALLTKGPVWRT